MPRLEKDLLNSYVDVVSDMIASRSGKVILQVAPVMSTPLVALIYVALKVIFVPAALGPSLSIVKFTFAPAANPVK